jgi:hypothetical protein
MGDSYQSSWDSNWSGASGQQIGFAGDYPETTGWGFTADEVHGQAYNPNGHNLNAQPGPDLEVPVEIQDNSLYGQWDGSDGWILDDIQFPSHTAIAGTVGHDQDLDAARAKRRDPVHAVDVYQDNQPTGHGVDFYGKSIDTQDYRPWTSPNAMGKVQGAFPAQAREDTGNWPEPFAVLTIAPNAPVVIDTEKIPMRRIKEDDRPVYRYLAIPAANIQPGGTQWLPAAQSNRILQNVKPTPQIARTPVDPWISEQDDSSQMYPDYTDIFGGTI